VALVQFFSERREDPMRAKSSISSICGILLTAGFLVSGVSAPARAQGYVGVAAGVYFPEDDDQDNTEVYGLRGGYRFRPNLGFEGSLSKVDLGDTIQFEDETGPGFDFDLQLDLYNLDLSLQWFPRGGNFVVFGGPGISQLRAKVEATFFGMTISESSNSDIFTAHAGLAYDWRINDRFFIRPEARVRRYFDDDIDEADLEEGFGISYKETDYEASLIFGWRFGS
jgi:Outer membrane protein beta-barrel domain